MTMQEEQAVPVEQSTEVPIVPDVDNFNTDNIDIIDTSNVQVDVANPTTDAPPAPPTPAPEPSLNASEVEMATMAQHNAALQQQVNQWSQWQQQQQMERAILDSSNATRTQLENQGYAEDQVELYVAQQQAFQRREMELQANLQRTQLHEEGRYRAAMHYSKLHGVDAEQLLPYNSPQEMESRAREMSRISQLEEKLAKYEKASVPPQNFESGTSQVTAVSNAEAWLDRYNAGDRSPEALSAARRAAGL